MSTREFPSPSIVSLLPVGTLGILFGGGGGGGGCVVILFFIFVFM